MQKERVRDISPQWAIVKPAVPKEDHADLRVRAKIKLIDWLSTDDQFNWTWFLTLTTPTPLTAKQAIRVMTRYGHKIQKEFLLSDKALKIFWVAEKFAQRDGYHIHALLSVPQRHDLAHVVHSKGRYIGYARLLDDLWHNSLGVDLVDPKDRSKGYQKNGLKVPKAHCKIVPINNTFFAVRYTAKYIVKDDSSIWTIDLVDSTHLDQKVEETPLMTPKEARAYTRRLKRNR